MADVHRMSRKVPHNHKWPLETLRSYHTTWCADTYIPNRDAISPLFNCEKSAHKNWQLRTDSVTRS